ncbi:PTS system mannose/fructose/N-acetylgalactosamine-transporter subunit IIB [Enterococcus sp. DIV0187]|uniref:PTS system mannose/fructose/N-acetylgalactosamine-transporter subunit IIB n=1 Tax=Enterococcus sp. DIV0187 TaxID=2774644 RepID=UPI003F28F7E0
MRIELARIDDRFIHGQVLTKWVKLRPVERIIVVSDAVANDEMRKTLVLSVAPSNIKASAVSVEKMARAYKSPKYKDAKAMLLFENPEDILRLVKLGVDLKEVNVGGMRFETDRKQITKAVSVREADVEAFKELSDLGVKLELRQLPGDQSVDFMKTLNTELGK